MNKKTLYVAILLAALTACQKAEYTAPATLSDEPIRFGAPGIALDGGLLSRAAGPVNEFPEGGSFGVLGYCLAMKGDNTDLDYSTGPDPWNSKAPRSTPHLFHKTEVAYNGSACYYTGTQRHWYERQDYLYSFFAYYPYSDDCFAVTPETQAGMGAPTMRFSMPFEGGTENTPREIERIPDAMVAASMDITRGDGHVDLRFYHLLTCLNFKVSNHNETNAVVVRGLRLKGTFYRSIEIDMAGDEVRYPADTYSGTFVFLDGAREEDDVNVTYGSPAEKIGGKSLMLVANLAASPYLGDAGIYIDYTFMGTEHTDKYIGDVANFLPMSGTIYTVELNFIGDAFVISFVVDNNQTWENGGDSDLEFE
ncbi:fimbrillin family protein [uncultured Alistipes sp.]|uniref:fimbrillin family protein n=1 Tax=uncultured Alistipes sp. TaxID=538949 RepID=UPI00259AD54E|nr:fimbrillin family protein [uncultured Alistipes sp.]